MKSQGSMFANSKSPLHARGNGSALRFRAVAVAMALASVALLPCASQAAELEDENGSLRPLRDVLKEALDEAPERAPAVFIDWCRRNDQDVEAIDDYTMTFFKRERVNGRLLDQERIFVKIRHRPFSIYMKHLDPWSLRGQEAIWVEGKNRGKLLAHSTGLFGLVGTLRLDPEGSTAMDGNRYPITTSGLLLMSKTSVDDFDAGWSRGALEISFRLDAEVKDKPCVLAIIEGTSRKKSPDMAYVEYYVEDESRMPVLYIEREWSKDGNPKGPLAEYYLHTDIDTDVGLTDLDFDTRNPEYDY